MSKVFNMVGGGGKNISSIVITGLESTDTVTCTKDGKTYPATWDETAQHWEIVGLPLGTFTVTATNGTKTVTKTVLIDIAGVYEIEMEYVQWLYKDGVEYIDVTGGWSEAEYNSGGTPVVRPLKNNDNIYFEGSTMKNTAIGTANYIDFSNYNFLKIDALPISTYTGYPFLHISVCDSTKNIAAPLMSGDSTTDLVRQTITIDISDISGGYIALWVGGITDYKGYVYKVWLE